MSVKDLISAAFNKDASSFENSFASVMQDKMSAAIQARFSPAMHEEEVDVNEEVEELDLEEVEELDEISKSTLGSYIKKATSASANQAFKLGQKRAQSDEIDRFTNRNSMEGGSDSHRETLKKAMGSGIDDINATNRTMNKRIRGISHATDKLSK